MKVVCPHCQKPLGVRLLSDYYSCVFCLACDRPLDLLLLSSVGVSAELIDLIKQWDKRSPKITGVGMEGDYGAGLGDLDFVKMWREIRTMTSRIFEELQGHLPIRIDVIDDVFKGTLDWADADILRWRHGKIRCRMIQQYGCLLGGSHVADGRKAPADEEDLPIPYPRGLAGQAEREAFQLGFRMGAALSRVTAGRGSAAEIVDLEKRLGLAR